MDEPLLDFNQELISLQQEYEIYCIYLNKTNKELTDYLNTQRVVDSKELLRLFVPRVEKLGDFLSTLNRKIKMIEYSDSYRNPKFKDKTNKTIKEIKANAAIQYENFNGYFFDIIKNPSNQQRKCSYTVNAFELASDGSLNASSNKSAKQNFYIQGGQNQLDLQAQSQTKSGLRREIQVMKNDDLELVMRISNQALQISKEMKASVFRAESSINTIEGNIIHVGDNLANANEETKKLNNANKGSISKYIWLFVISSVVVVVLVFVLYKTLLS